MSKPMHEPTFLILTSLLGGPLHGYAILSEVAAISDNRMRIGTLYAALERLNGEGLVEVAGEDVVNGRLRRSYRLTGVGEHALTQETQRLESLAKQARRRLRHRPALSRLVVRTGVVR
jgi:DNA-binding PadR family transcriptional regulator